MIVALAVATPLWLYIGVLLARDADRHGAHGGLVGAAFVLVFPLGVWLWLQARASGRERDGEATHL